MGGKSPLFQSLFDPALLKAGLSCTCPRCGTGRLYPPGFHLTLRPACDHCGLDLAKNDSADGPAVFLIFILGFLIVPMAIVTIVKFHWPLWAVMVVWGGLTLGLTVGSIRNLKAYIIALQYRHRPNDWVG